MTEVRKNTLTPELIEKARLELNEDPSQVPDQIVSFREKILEDPNRNFRTDDAFLLRFLRVRKFDQERALELIVNYYRQREYYHEMFRVSKEDLEEGLANQAQGALLNKDSEGRAVIMFSMGRWDPQLFQVDHVFLAMVATLEALVEDEGVQINGSVWIVDLQGLNMSHITCFTPWKVKQAVTVLLNSFPMRCKALHYVNESPLFDGLFAMTRPLLSKKIQDRIMFHGDCLASLHEYVDPEILPEELGGDLDSLDHSRWNQKLLEGFEDFIQDVNKYGFFKDSADGKETQ